MNLNTGNPIVDEINQIEIKGNIIPAVWYKTITKENGKPHLLAINILADIVYWYKPAEVRDEQSGSFIGYRKRFKEDLLQRSYDNLADMFGCSKVEAQRAIVFLETLGVVKRHLRTVVANHTKLGNVLYIELIPTKLKEITHPEGYPLYGKVNPSLRKSKEVFTQKSGGLDGKVKTYTEITTDNSTEITTDIITTATTADGEAEENENELKLIGGTLGRGVVMMTDAQFDHLCEILSKDELDAYMERMANFILKCKEKNGKAPNISHYKTILKWVDEDRAV